MNLDTFFEKFELFADAPNAVAKMREFILHLAGRGKLVPQNLHDESAVILLQKINQRRQELLLGGYPNREEAVGQLRKQSMQLLPDGLDALPPGWQWATLMQISLLVVDCHNKTAPYAEHGIRLLRTTNIRNGKLNSSDPKYVDEDTYERWSARCKPQEGDILITREAPMGEVCIIPENMKICMGQRMMLIRLISEFVNSKFLLYSLMDPSLMDRVQDKPVGATVQHLRVGGIETLLIPFPPLAEQKRIVAKVDELMALCDRLEAQQQQREIRHTALAQASLTRFADAPTPANLELLFHKSYAIEPAELRKSILTLAVRGKLVAQNFDDEPASELLNRVSRELPADKRRRQAAPLPPLSSDLLQYDVPESWTWARFRDVAIIASNLVNPNDFLDFVHLAPDNIEKGNGVLLSCATVREDKVISSNHRFYPGQIVYSKIRPNLAKVVVVDFEGLCSADMYPIDALVHPKYLQYYMLSDSFLVQAVRTDTRVAMPKINQLELNAIAVPVPPLPEQKRIVAKVEQLMGLVDRLEAQLAESRAKATALLDAVVAELSAAA